MLLKNKLIYFFVECDRFKSMKMGFIINKIAIYYMNCFNIEPKNCSIILRDLSKTFFFGY